MSGRLFRLLLGLLRLLQPQGEGLDLFGLLDRLAFGRYIGGEGEGEVVGERKRAMGEESAPCLRVRDRSSKSPSFLLSHDSAL